MPYSVLKISIISVDIIWVSSNTEESSIYLGYDGILYGAAPINPPSARYLNLSLPALSKFPLLIAMSVPSVKNLVKVHNKSELHVIQNCGHVVNIDKPEIFNKRMLDFLERSI